MYTRVLLTALAALVLSPLPAAFAQPEPNFTRTEDVIYGRKSGMALTMDIFAPKDSTKANGKGIIWCVSGGWVSNKPGGIGPGQEFVNRGYTEFAVMHGSAPKFTIPEAIEDMHRAVRFIKANAKKYNIDPDALGSTGGSAGGHLSLMIGCAPRPANPKSKDPLDQYSSNVAAVACFFPPTDFLNYGKDGESGLGEGILKNFKGPFDFQEYDADSRGFVTITDPSKRQAIGKSISPVYHVTKGSAPALIIHGDADKLVPIQQSELIIARFKACDVPCELAVRKGAGHGGPAFASDPTTLADWFDKHLTEKK